MTYTTFSIICAYIIVASYSCLLAPGIYFRFRDRFNIRFDYYNPTHAFIYFWTCIFIGLTLIALLYTIITALYKRVKLCSHT